MEPDPDIDCFEIEIQKRLKTNKGNERREEEMKACESFVEWEDYKKMISNFNQTQKQTETVRQKKEYISSYSGKQERK